MDKGKTTPENTFDAPFRLAVFDCESDALFSELPGDRSTAFGMMRWTCAAVSFPLNGITEPILFVQGQERQLINCLDGADIICAYNVSFDLQLLRKEYEKLERGNMWYEHARKAFDPMDHIRRETGIWPKLDHMCAANGLSGKTSGVNGCAAVDMFRDGRLDELYTYVKQDVRALATLVCRPDVLNVPIPIITPLPKPGDDRDESGEGEGGTVECVVIMSLLDRLHIFWQTGEIRPIVPGNESRELWPDKAATHNLCASLPKCTRQVATAC